MSLHFYPLVNGCYSYESTEAEAANLAVLEAMAREAAKPGLPLVIAEFGWYGGGPIDSGGKPATEEQQAEWCGHVVEATAPIACGWLNWGMYDHPEAKDVSRLRPMPNPRLPSTTPRSSISIAWLMMSLSTREPNDAP